VATASASVASAQATKREAWVNELLASYAAPESGAASAAGNAALRQRFEQMLDIAWKACPSLCADNVIPQAIQNAAAFLANDTQCPPGAALYRHVTPLQQARVIDHLSAQDRLYTAAW